MRFVNKKKLSVNIFLLSVVPLILVVTFMATLLFSQAKQLVEEEVSLIRANIVASKKQELQQYVELAVKAITPYYDSDLPQDEAKQKVRDKLTQMTYGNDGYFFAYDWQGEALVLPYQTDRIGKNWWQVEDVQGKKLLQELIKVSKADGGFVDYQWHKPSKSEPLPKLSYAVGLDKWGWMIGTGVYLDDVEQQVMHMHKGFDDKVSQSAAAVFAVMIVAVFVIAAVGASLNLSVKKLANEQLSLLNEQIIDSQENERRRVSRELHDGVNQLLVAAKYRIDNVRDEDDENKKQKELESSKLAMDQAIVELRRISRDLRPPQLDDLGLVAGIDAYLEELRGRTDLELLFEHDIDQLKLQPEVETTLYRITQEALHNVEKHAIAKGADVILQREGDELLLTISDDGIGFRTSRKQGKKVIAQNMGLRNMAERIQALGGKFTVSSELGQGTEVRVSLNMELL
ncbi:cache domain-containing protein [uncultured Vibrio sp.]|uniref:cache domain-containing protein n=1 Tax=uncultured Vibrio sp. TaxID=114054 RepID=UPI0025FE2B69|nr:cache domain-containing protein [uncultured Vibrio sp.]